MSAGGLEERARALLAALIVDENRSGYELAENAEAVLVAALRHERELAAAACDDERARFGPEGLDAIESCKKAIKELP